MRTSLAKLLTVAAAALFAVSCTEKQEEPKTMTLDPASLSFKGKEAEPQTVNVNCDASWKATADAKWLTITPGEKSFAITVTDNEEDAERKATVTVTAPGYNDATLAVTQRVAPVEGNDVISIDPKTVAFKAQDNEAQTINVVCDAEWTATPSDQWITVTPGEGSFTVTAADNGTTAPKEGTVTVAAEGYDSAVLTVTQEAAESYYRYFSELLPFSMAMSPSGRYVAGLRQEVEGDNFTYFPFIMDLATGEEHHLDGIPDTLFEMEDPNCVTDQGLVYYSHGITHTVMVDLDNTHTDMPVFEGYKYAPNVYGTSADGSIFVCSASRYNEAVGTSHSIPLKVVDGIPSELEFPNVSFRGNPVKQACGIIMRGCSLDGSVCWGTDWQGFDGGLCYWTNDDGNKFHWVGEEDGHRYARTETGWDPIKEKDCDYYLIDGVQGWGSARYMSPNGKWIAGLYSEEKLEDDRMTTVKTMRVPYFFDIVNKKGYKLEQYPDHTGVAVTDDGIGFVCAADQASSTIVVDAITGEKIGDLVDWIQTNYNIIIPGDTIAEYIAPNGVFFGKRLVMSAFGGATYPGLIVVPGDIYAQWE